MDLRKLIKQVFDIQKNERVVLLYDMPHDNIPDNTAWQERRAWLDKWEEAIGKVDRLSFLAVGKNNAPLPQDILDQLTKYDVILAFTEYSATAPLIPICEQHRCRAASMPAIHKGMEKSALAADYSEVKKYALAIKELLNEATQARITFSTGDKLILDLAGMSGMDDNGECTQPGELINLPAGEAFICPKESVHSQGVLPFSYDGELVRFVVENNRIVRVEGEGKHACEMREFFSKKPSRAYIAELGIGCNPCAIVTGNVLEDEKAGIHIAYGHNTHFEGGTNESDVHEDLVFAADSPIVATRAVLVLQDREVNIAHNGKILYDSL